MGKALESRTYFLEEKQDGPETCHGARPPPRPCSPPQHIVHSHLLLLLEVHPSKSPIKTIQAGDIGWTFRGPSVLGSPTMAAQSATTHEACWVPACPSPTE